MKFLFMICLMMVFALSGCGGKDNESGNNGSVSTITNGNQITKTYSGQSGYLNLQTQVIELNNGQTFPPTQQYASIVNAAIQQASYKNVQPVQVNGVMKLKATVTYQEITYNYNYNSNTVPYMNQSNYQNNYQYNQMNNYYPNQGQITLTGITFY